MKIIFIIGSSRSGTTMLNRILNNHSNIKGMNELHYFNDILNYNEISSNIKFNRQIEITTKTLNRYYNDLWTKFDDKLYLTEAKEIASIDAINGIQLFKKIMRHIKSAENVEWICEQTPKNILYLKDLINEFPNSIFIHLVRDPRASMLSQKNRWKKKYNGHNEIPIYNVFRLLINYHPFTFIKVWKKGIEIGFRFNQNKNYLLIRFEDILNNPKLEISKLMNLLSLNYEPHQIQITQKGSSNKYNSKSEYGINKEINNKWKYLLSNSEINYIQRKVHNEMKELNYSLITTEKKVTFFKLKLNIKYIFHLIGIFIINPKTVIRTLKKILIVFVFLNFINANKTYGQEFTKEFKIIEIDSISKRLNFIDTQYLREKIKQNIFDFEYKLENSDFNSLNFKINDTLNISIKNSYKISFEEKKINIEFSDKLAGIYSINSLNKIISDNDGLIYFKKIFDFPSINERYAHLILPNSSESKKKLYSLIDFCIINKFNGVIIQLKDRLNLFNESNYKNDWRVSDLEEVANYVKQFGLKFIVEIKFLTHQEKSYFNDTELINKYTYNPYNENVNRRIEEIIEIIDSKIKPTGIHIGHDELHGYRNNKQRYFINNKLESKSFFYDINNIYSKISSNIEIFMWSDMLLDFNKFPDFIANGNKEFSDQIDKLPDNIILIDWQYWSEDSFITYDFLASKKPTIAGAVWCKKQNISNFSDHIKTTGELRNRIIIATTWPGALSNKTELIEKGQDLFTEKEIIEYSGKEFWK